MGGGDCHDHRAFNWPQHTNPFLLAQRGSATSHTRSAAPAVVGLRCRVRAPLLYTSPPVLNTELLSSGPSGRGIAAHSTDPPHYRSLEGGRSEGALEICGRGARVVCARRHCLTHVCLCARAPYLCGLQRAWCPLLLHHRHYRHHPYHVGAAGTRIPAGPRATRAQCIANYQRRSPYTCEALIV